MLALAELKGNRAQLRPMLDAIREHENPGAGLVAYRKRKGQCLPRLDRDSSMSPISDTARPNGRRLLRLEITHGLGSGSFWEMQRTESETLPTRK